MLTQIQFIDYSKAFDKVDHRLLLLKLQKYKFLPALVQWIESFLSARSQTVMVEGNQSYKASIKSGVPHGTVLGPVLFIIFMNDLEILIENSSIRFFADETRISKQIFQSEDTALLQTDLDTVLRWSRENNMKLHDQEQRVS